MAQEQLEIERLKSQLLVGAGRVPVAQYQSWDVERVRAFKRAVVAARKAANKRGVSLGELRAASNALATYWS